MTFESDDYQTVQGLVAAGVGVALIPELALSAVREDIVDPLAVPRAAGAPGDRGRARRGAPGAGRAGDAGGARTRRPARLRDGEARPGRSTGTPRSHIRLLSRLATQPAEGL